MWLQWFPTMTTVSWVRLDVRILTVCVQQRGVMQLIVVYFVLVRQGKNNGLMMTCEDQQIIVAEWRKRSFIEVIMPSLSYESECIRSDEAIWAVGHIVDGNGSGPDSSSHHSDDKSIQILLLLLFCCYYYSLCLFVSLGRNRDISIWRSRSLRWGSEENVVRIGQSGQIGQAALLLDRGQFSNFTASTPRTQWMD